MYGRKVRTRTIGIRMTGDEVTALEKAVAEHNKFRVLHNLRPIGVATYVRHAIDKAILHGEMPE